jgi:glycosyltransferase EpsD
MACGLPVIASDIKGHRELVLDERYGLLFRNFAELKGSIKQISRDTTLKTSLRKTEPQRLEEFALPVVFDDIMGQYRSAL